MLTGSATQPTPHTRGCSTRADYHPQGCVWAAACVLPGIIKALSYRILDFSTALTTCCKGEHKVRQRGFLMHSTQPFPPGLAWTADLIRYLFREYHWFFFPAPSLLETSLFPGGNLWLASSANRCSGKCEGKEDEDGYFLGKREPLPLWRGVGGWF